MPTEPAQKRPLSSLTTWECQTLFALAFGYGVPDDLLTAFSLTSHFPAEIQDTAPYTLGDHKTRLVIFPEGDISAYRVEHEGNEPARFNTVKVVGYLHSLNIAFGPQQTPKRPFTSLTSAECYVLFVAAYGYEPAKLDKYTINGPTSLYITDDVFHLVLYSDGSIGSARPDECGRSLTQKFNARKLITHIDALKLQFEPNREDSAEASPQPPVQS